MSVIKDVQVLFSNVVNVDDLSQKYQVVVNLNEEQAADVEELGLAVKTKEYDGKVQYRCTFKSKYKPRVVGPDGQTDLDLGPSEVARHSLVSVQYNLRPWAHLGKTGTSQDLQMIQVKKMEAGNSSQFEDESTFGETNSDY